MNNTDKLLSEMTQSERFDYILKLESDSLKQKLKRDLAAAKHKNKMDTLNAVVSIAVMHTNIVVAAALGGIER